MEIRENLSLIEVNYENSGKKAILVFLDEERGEIREVNFNCQAYKDGKYVDDEEKVQKVQEWCKNLFDTTFENLSSCVGQKKNVYCYDKFNSLFEVAQVKKFDESMKGQLYEATITEITMDDVAIRIRYKIKSKDDIYESKMVFANWVESMKRYLPNPQKRDKALEKFRDKFHKEVSEADALIGVRIYIEVKAAFGSKLYGEIKALPEE